MTRQNVGQVGGRKTPAIRTTPPSFQARMLLEHVKTGTLTAAIFLIESEDLPTEMETQQLR